MNADSMHAAATAAGITLRIVRSQIIPESVIPQRSIATCPKCRESWEVVTDRGGVTRRADDGSIKRRTWRRCPNGCNANRLNH